MKKVTNDTGLNIPDTSKKSMASNKSVSSGSANKISEGVPDYQLGNLFQGKSVALGSQNKNLNAKKLDINFDNDDFFNSFEPVSSAPKPKKIEISKPKESTEQKDSTNQFDVSSWTFDSKKGEVGGGASETTGAKKASSSQGGAADDDVQARYEQLVKSGATAISSDMLFGREEEKKQPASQGGRWSQPAVAASLQAMGENASAAIGTAMSRSSLGSKYYFYLDFIRSLIPYSFSRRGKQQFARIQRRP